MSVPNSSQTNPVMASSSGSAASTPAASDSSTKAFPKLPTSHAATCKVATTSNWDELTPEMFIPIVWDEDCGSQSPVVGTGEAASAKPRWIGCGGECVFARFNSALEKVEGKVGCKKLDT